jgi:hypothetical protein
MPFDGFNFRHKPSLFTRIKDWLFPQIDDLTTQEILVRAKTLIGRPSDWCRGEFRTRSGRYCAVGAIMRVGMPIHRRIFGSAVFNRHANLGMNARMAITALDAVSKKGGYPGAYAMNDIGGHGVVMQMFDKAIIWDQSQRGFRP